MFESSSNANLKTNFVGDFSALAELKVRSQIDPDASLAEVAGQFESLFVNLLLDSMRDATVDGGLFDGPGLQMYQEMFDRQIAQEVSSGGGIGIADMLVRQLGAQEASNRVNAPVQVNAFSSSPALPAPVIDGSVGPRSHQHPAPTEAPTWTPEPPEPPEHPEFGAARAVGFESPEQFVEQLWPQARAAAEVLGQDPRVLLAQAALETGWGKSVIGARGDASSHNLFGIKAGSGWSGDRVRVQTLEVVDGVFTPAMADFRAYSSFEESFADYVSLVRSSPRYAPAMEMSGDPAGYLRALQDGGYATDPEYADKVLSIVARSTIQGPPIRDTPDA